MPARAIVERLRSGETLLLDGATGSEIARRGVYVSKGSTEDKLGPWSATANLDAPEIVRQVHEDYLRLGVDVITSNNFWTSRPKLAEVGLAERWEEIARTAGQIALAARDAVNGEAYVAGGIAPPIWTEGAQRAAERHGGPAWRANREIRPQEELHRELSEQARLLADLGVDLILAEYVGPIADCVTAVDACATAGRPVFLGVRHVTTDGTMQYGESFEELARALRGRPVDAILLMCSDPPAISASLPRLRRAFDRPIGAYANIGYRKNPSFGQPGEQWHVIDQATYPPASYADFAREWKAIGAQIIGGCCATGPEHIAAISELVKGH
ncbi:MAG TPA: homocysteine S-methyltransferase family protein [Chloroflexota bacterium]